MLSHALLDNFAAFHTSLETEFGSRSACACVQDCRVANSSQVNNLHVWDVGERKANSTLMLCVALAYNYRSGWFA